MASIVAKRTVVVRTTFDAVHQWKDAPKDPTLMSSILQYPHRHKFYVEVRVPVTDPDRQIEFLQLKEVLDVICRDRLNEQGTIAAIPLPYSCETMAEMIGNALLAYDWRFLAAKTFTVSVFEDNENGAEVIFE